METSKQNERPKYWILGWDEPQLMSKTKPGEEIEYSSKGDFNQRSNVSSVKEGEIVFWYEGEKGKKGIVSIMKVKKENDGKQVVFEKVENLASPISYDVMKECPNLKDKIHGIQYLTVDEYGFIMELIRESIEEADDKYYQEEIRNEVLNGNEEVPDDPHDEIVIKEINGVETVERKPKKAKYVLSEAGYKCAIDPSHKTFTSSKGLLYMEAHHLVPCTPTNAQMFKKRNNYHLDSVSNIVCLCPTCHRGIHYGNEETKKDFITKLYNQQKEKYEAAGLNITLDELLELYKVK